MMRRSIRFSLRFIIPPLVIGLLAGWFWSFLLLVGLGLFEFGRVLYYCFRFNDCKQAADSLRKEVVQARVDLTRKGFNFVT